MKNFLKNFKNFDTFFLSELSCKYRDVFLG